VLWEEISQYIFQLQEKHSKNVYTPNAHTVVIDLGDGKSFTAILKTFRFTLMQMIFYILTSLMR
jgi:hypothetical protein